MSEKTENTRLQLPDELLDQVSGGWTPKDLTKKERDTLNELINGIKTETDKNKLKKLKAEYKDFCKKMDAKYGALVHN